MKQIFVFDIKKNEFIKNGDSVEFHWVNSESDLTEIYKDKEVIFTEVLYQNPILENEQLREMTIEELKLAKKIQLGEGEKISEGKLITIPQSSKNYIWNFEKEEWKFSAELRKAEILAELDNLDIKSIRPNRAFNLGISTTKDKEKLEEIEAEARKLREELASYG